MKPLLLGGFLSAAILVSCSPTGPADPTVDGSQEQTSGLVTALESIPYDGEHVSFLYGAPNEIRDILNYTPTDDGLAPDTVTVVDQWRHFAPNALFPSDLLGSPIGVPLFERSDARWAATGFRPWAHAVGGFDVDAAKQRLEDGGWESADGSTYLPPDTSLGSESDTAVFSDDQVQVHRSANLPADDSRSLADDEAVAALLDCLDGAQAVFIKRGDSGSPLTYSLAASVNAEAEGSSWACVHSPEMPAEAVAEQLTQQEANPLQWIHTTVGDVTVDGDVIRLELTPEPMEGRSAPAEVMLVVGARESGPPYF